MTIVTVRDRRRIIEARTNKPSASWEEIKNDLNAIKSVKGNILSKQQMIDIYKKHVNGMA
jgi:predicted nucleic acid-binding OB-fold protein